MLCVPGSAALDKRFSTSYRQARARFVAAARRRGNACRLDSFPHPLRGRDREALWLDVAWLGPEDARGVLVTQSATHGIEGYAGSALQIDHLLSGALPDGLAIMHLHALNPHGFSWGRRVNEDGVDLNRNFIDFGLPLPANPDFELVRDALLPPDAAHWPAANRRLQVLQAELGSVRFEQAVSGGQYADAAGLFYGGAGPSWSRRCLQVLFEQARLPDRDLVCVLDFHTGLGPFGYGEIICDHPPGSAGANLARAWFGQSVTEPALGTSSSVPKTGLVDYAWQGALGDRVCFVTLEFGTYPFQHMMDALRQDHFWQAQPAGRRDPAGLEAARAAVARHFYPGHLDWKQALAFRGRQVIGQALDGLSRECGR